MNQRPGYNALKRKTFHNSVVRELRKHIPTLGELTAQPLAQHIEDLVTQYFPSQDRVRIGEILWPAVDKLERGALGKRIEQTKIKPVLLQLVTEDDVEDYLSGMSISSIRKKVLIRLFEQAQQQGALLTRIEASMLMHQGPATIGQYIKEIEAQRGKPLPTRGTVHDIGSSITHKVQICRKVILEGCSIDQTAKETSHAPESVTRYIKSYRRVQKCKNAGLSVEETAYVTKQSIRLVREYLELIKEHELYRRNQEVQQ